MGDFRVEDYGQFLCACTYSVCIFSFYIYISFSICFYFYKHIYNSHLNISWVFFPALIPNIYNMNYPFCIFHFSISYVRLVCIFNYFYFVLAHKIFSESLHYENLFLFIIIYHRHLC